MPKRKPAPKPQQSVQLSAVTRKQMRELAALWGMPETRHATAVIRRAVEYTHEQLIGDRKMEIYELPINKLSPKDLFDRAEARVDRSPALRQYKDFILADWPEGDEHLRWVCRAPVKEIIEWAAAGQPNEI